jgi:hypothetical protein
MPIRRTSLALLATAALGASLFVGVRPTSAAPSPSSITVGVDGAGPASASFSGGPITGSDDASGNVTPPPICSAPSCETIPVTLKAPHGLPANKITLTVTVIFDQTANTLLGLSGLDTYIFDSQGNLLASDTLGSTPSVASAGKLDPGQYTIEITGESAAANETYTGTAAACLPGSCDIQPVATSPVPLRFGPSTVVSPTILGGEPQISFERPVAQPKDGAGLDPNRGFVDWPVSSRTNIGTLWRTQNGGDSYRQLVDLTCAERQVPNCNTGGGGDTVNRVNNYDGTLLFGDQESLAQEAFASSADHGDSFPAARQWAATSTATGVDRQWISSVDAPGYTVGPATLDALFSYHIPAAGEYVAGVASDGTLIPAVTPVISQVSQSGPSRIDTQPGSRGRGWFYQSYRDGGGFEVAAAPISQFQVPTAYKVHLVTGDQPQVFPWIALDTHGNLYAAWIAPNGQLYYSYSLIDDPANDPTATPTAGVPATKWAQPHKVNPPSLGSIIFPEIVAGDPGHIAIAFMATGDWTGVSDSAPAGTNPARWGTYVTMSQDALGTAPTFQIGTVSHRFSHLGSICTSGTTCLVSSGDRSLLDMIDLTIDSSGRVAVVYTDNNYQFARDEISMGSQGAGYVKVARLASGPSLFAGHPGSSVTYPTAYRAAAAGDATWPNAAGASNLPTFDILGSGVSVEGNQVVTRINLADASAAGFASDLAAYNAADGNDLPATRQQYVLRWDSADGQTYYMAAEVGSSGTPSFYGGKVDGTSAVSNVSSAVAIAYRPQSAYPVTGEIQGNSLILRAPLSAFGLHTGSTLLGFAGFSLAGPSDQVLSGAPETSQVVASMRTADSAPPIDAVLAAVSSPVPTPTPGTPNQPATPAASTLPNTTAAAPRDGVALVLSGLAIAVVITVGARRRRRAAR